MYWDIGYQRDWDLSSVLRSEISVSGVTADVLGIHSSFNNGSIVQNIIKILSFIRPERLWNILLDYSIVVHYYLYCFRIMRQY